MPVPSTTRDSLPYIYCGNALLQETGPGKKIQKCSNAPHEHLLLFRFMMEKQWEIIAWAIWNVRNTYQRFVAAQRQS